MATGVKEYTRGRACQLFIRVLIIASPDVGYTLRAAGRPKIQLDPPGYASQWSVTSECLIKMIERILLRPR